MTENVLTGHETRDRTQHERAALGKAAADVAWYLLEASARRGVRIVGQGVITRPVRDHEKIPA